MKIIVHSRNTIIMGIGLVLILLVSIMLGYFLPDQTEFVIEKPVLMLFSILPQYLPSFTTVFLSILIEALPFILIGVFVSAFIQIFISEETIRRILPSSRITSLILACSLGIIFPVCECGIIPIVRRLVNKGVPLYAGISFMLAVPIINPVVAASTYFAFYGDPRIVLFRIGLSFAVAFLVGFLISCKRPSNQLKTTSSSACGCSHCSHSHGHHHQPVGFSKSNIKSKIRETFLHACDEFFDMGKYLIVGSLLAASMQTFVARSTIMEIGQGSLSSTLTMMATAFVMSICSEADAFVAASFKGTFTAGSIIAFLVYGPMLDIKNTLMLYGTFKNRFVLYLIGLVTALVFAGSYLINLFF